MTKDLPKHNENATTDGVNARQTAPAENKGTTRDSEAKGAMSRRAMLIATGAATASVAGCVGTGGTDDSAQLQSLAVYGYGGDQVMASTPETVTVSESEPNDNRTEAMAISLGTKVDGKLDSAEVDWFGFDANSGQRVVIEFSREATNGVTSIILYGPDGDFQGLVYAGTEDPVHVIETLDKSGTHYVEIVDIQDSEGAYTLTLTTDSESTTGTPTPSPTPTPTPTATATPTPTPTSTPVEDDYAEQKYGEYGYGGVDA